MKMRNKKAERQKLVKKAARYLTAFLLLEKAAEALTAEIEKGLGYKINKGPNGAFSIDVPCGVMEFWFVKVPYTDPDFAKYFEGKA